MAGEMTKGFLLKIQDSWLINFGGHTYRVADEDASHCSDSDDGNFVDFTVDRNASGEIIARLGNRAARNMSWDEIEEWYLSDNYPPFGGPFTDAMTPFQWLRIYFNEPKTK